MNRNILNNVKKILGIVWISLGFVIAYAGFTVMGYPKLISGKQDDLVFGIIITFILLPIIVGGLIVFGKYSLEGAYEDLNDN